MEGGGLGIVGGGLGIEDEGVKARRPRVGDYLPAIFKLCFKSTFDKIEEAAAPVRGVKSYDFRTDVVRSPHDLSVIGIVRAP